VSEEVWRKFCEFYPGSGPAITMIYSSKENQGGFFPTTAFTIVDAVPDPEDKDLKKGRKKRFPNLFNKDNSGNIVDSSAESKDTEESKANSGVESGRPIGDSTALLKSGGAPREQDSDDDSDAGDHHTASDLASMLKSNNTRVDVKTPLTTSPSVPYQKATPPDAKDSRIRSKDSDKEYEKVFGFTS